MSRLRRSVPYARTHGLVLRFAGYLPKVELPDFRFSVTNFYFLRLPNKCNYGPDSTLQRSLWASFLPPPPGKVSFPLCVKARLGLGTPKRTRIDQSEFDAVFF